MQEDYEDYLRQHRLRIWDKNEPKYPHIPHDPELACNLMIMLCQRTTYLLEKQIESLKEKFIKEGGFRENLFKKRLEEKIKTGE